MLSQLVRSPSISSTSADLDQSNREVINHLANWLDDLSFKIDIVQLPGNPAKTNLIAKIGEGDGGLVLSGHSDTVPTDEENWDSDPFDVWQSDEGRYYGLGCCDMKGFFPVALHAAKQAVRKQPKKPLIIVATADEETSMAGARHLLAENQLNADAAVIGEPTNLRPVYAHKGIVLLKINTFGTPGHSSNPDDGINALETMHKIMSEVLEFKDALKRDHMHPAFAVRYPTLNLGCLHAGDNANRICGSAELLIDLRITPNLKFNDLLPTLKDRLNAIGAQLDVPVSVEEVFSPIPPFEIDRKKPLVQFIEQCCGQSAITVAFGTEAPFMQRLGIETVVFGAGSIDQAHRANEYVDSSQHPKAQRVFEKLIDRYCY